MLTPQQIKEIEESFETTFEKWIFHNEHGLCVFPDNIKSFIITTINSILAERDKEILAFINSGHPAPSNDSGWSVELNDVENFIKKNK